MTQIDTKDRILDAAERLFSEQGVRGVSLRAITSAAEVNLAAVSYHFGSKEGLIKAVLARRVEPINAARLSRLSALEAAGEPGLEDVLEALLKPVFEMSADPRAGAFCTQLVGRVQSEADATFREFCSEHFQEVRNRFFAAIARSCPDLDEGTLLWRFHFMLGAMFFTMSHGLNLAEHSGGRCDPQDAPRATAQMVAFTAAGFRAAPTPEPASEPAARLTAEPQSTGTNQP